MRMRKERGAGGYRFFDFSKESNEVGLLPDPNWTAKSLLKENLELNPRQGSHSFGHEGTKLQPGCGWSPWRRPYVLK